MTPEERNKYYFIHLRAIDEVRRERLKQMTMYDVNHDDSHSQGEIAVNAVKAIGDAYGVRFTSLPCEIFGLRIRNKRDALVKGAAMMIAEIERLDREKK